MSSSRDVVALRQTLLNPSSCSEFTAFVAVKGDSLESNVHFWLEVQKFKVKMPHVPQNRPFGQATRRDKKEKQRKVKPERLKSLCLEGCHSSALQYGRF